MTTPSSGNAKTVRITVDKKQVLVELVEGDNVKDRDRFNPDLKSKRRSFAKTAGVDDATLMHWIDESKKLAAAGNNTTQVFTPLAATAHAAGDILVRLMNERDDQGTRHALNAVRNLTDLLPTVPNDYVLKWTDANALCCLDVDYHDRKPPHESWLRARVVADLVPRPYAWHFSKGGGLHLFYVRSEPFAAEELAAVAALSFRRIDPTAAVELKTMVRGPAEGGKQDGDRTVHYTPGGVQDTTTLLAGWSERTSADDAARDEWLEAEGLEIGKRYDHTKCPINPTPGYASTGEPVSILEGGVKCFRCEGEGRSLRVRTPGFAPYTAIIGGESAGELGDMLRNICHWGHARFILIKKYGLLEPFAEKAYRAALKAFHHGKKTAPLIPLAFLEETKEFTRLGNQWYNMTAGLPYIEKRINTIIAMLPSVNTFGDDEKPKPNEAKITVLMQPHGIEKMGYPAIDTVFGQSLKKHHMFNPDDPATVEVYDASLRQAGDRSLPQYIPGSRRNVEEAWGIIEEIAPGIDRKLVTLVIAAIGTAQETRLGMHPRIFVTGTSASGKTTTPKFAAAMMGTRTSDFVHVSDEYRWQQRMYSANREGGLVLLNELIKDAERAKQGKPMSLREPFDPLLNVTPDARINVMHIGPMPYGRLPAWVLTEPKLPLGIRDELQIARRMWHWRVNGTKVWTDSFFKAGLSDVPLLRKLSQKVAQACDMIVSQVIDDFFAVPTPWEQIAEAHGCQNVAKSDEFDDMTPYMRELFRLVCLAPALSNKRHADRYPNGYKKIVRPGEDVKPGEEEALTSTYTQFADGRGSEWLKARRLTEKDWRDVLKTDKDVEIDLTDDGSNVFIRFRVGKTHSPIEVNGQIVDPTNWEAKP